MADTPDASVEAYLAAQPDVTRRVLVKVRAALRTALPGAEEVISYRIPAYRLHGRIVIYFAGWKEHYALYPVTADLIAAFEKELAPYELSHKGTVRFPLDAPVPAPLIVRIAKYRAAQVVARRAAKAGGRSPKTKAKTKSPPKPKAKAKPKRNTAR